MHDNVYGFTVLLRYILTQQMHFVYSEAGSSDARTSLVALEYVQVDV